MSTESPPAARLRVLVALDSSPHATSALETAVDLARRLHAELLGFFVEDARLLATADVGLSRLVDRSGQARPVERAELETQLRAHARQLQAQLERAAVRARVPWTFRVARGGVIPELLAAAGEVDLVCLGKAGEWAGSRTGSTAAAVACRASRSVLVVQRGLRLRSPVLVLHDGTPEADRTAAVAGRLVPSDDGRLVVLSTREDAEAAERAAERLRADGHAAETRQLEAVTPASICRVARSIGAGGVVLSGSSARLGEEGLAALLGEACCPLAIVR